MRVFGYSVREDEEKYFQKCSTDLGIEVAYTSVYPSLDNADLVKGYDAVSIITNVVTKEMYDAWRSYGVKYIATRSVGYDHLDLAYMKKQGMKGVHASYSPNAVANYTIMLMLMACRNITYILDKAKLQDFSLPGKMGKELSMCTVGVIGTGQIGETLIKHLSGFGCRILANDMYQKESVKTLAEYTDLETIYRESDIITLHVPGMEANRHMINAETISKMKDGVILVNAARGMLVDSYALIEALEKGKVGFAALDTFDEEIGLYYKDLEREKPVNRTLAILNSMENVILSPHMAFYTEQSVSDMVGTTLKGLAAFESGEANPAEIKF